MSMILLVAAFLPQDVPPGRIGELIEKLGADRIEDREEAERELRDLGRPAVPALEKASLDPDHEVAERARRSIRAIMARLRITPALREAMPGIEDRLAEGGDPVWTRTFLEANAGYDQGRPRFKDEDLDSLAGPAVRGARDRDEKWAVCRVAAKRRCRSAVPDLIRLLGDPEGCANAIHALRRLDAREAIPPLIRLLDHEDILTSRNAVDALGELRAREALPEIARLTRHEDGYMRLDAAKALKEIGLKEAVPVLFPLLEDPEAYVRCMAVSALGSLGGKEAVPGIVKRLGDDRVDVRREAVVALRGLGARETAPHVVRLLRDDDPAIFLAAGELLVRWQAKEVVPRVMEALRDDHDRVRETALSTLAGLKAVEAVPEVEGLLGSPDPLTRRAALRALGWLGSKESLAGLLKGLRDGDGSVREAAAAALGDLAARDAMPEIVRLLEDVEGRVRARVLETLAEVEAAAEVSRIAGFLQDEKGEVRRAAAEALCALGSAEGVAHLLQDAGISSGASLFALNALRRREVWRRLRGLSLRERPREEAEGDVVESVARRAGLAVEVETPGSPGATPRTCFWFPPWEGPSRGTDALWKALAGASCEVILEPDRVRIVPSAQALAFWKQWWEEERPKR